MGLPWLAKYNTLTVTTDGEIHGDDLQTQGRAIQSHLRDVASQENCDGFEYDLMCAAADYIDLLEERAGAKREKNAG